MMVVLFEKLLKVM